MSTSVEPSSESADVVELRIAARAENVALARLALNGVATAAGAPPAVVADLKLAVSEVCTNAVQHAYRKPGPTAGSLVILRFAVRGRRLVVEVDDEGSGFGLSTPDRREDDAAGWYGLGMGLTIVRSVTDQLKIESGPGGTRVVFSRAF